MGIEPDLRLQLERFQDPLERQAAVGMVELAHQYPGSSFRALVRHVPTGELRSRMIRQHLIEGGVLAEESVLGALRIYPGHVKDATARKHIAALRDPDTAELYALLRSVTWRQRDLFREAEEHGWSREKARRCLAKLEHVGLVQRGVGTARYPSWCSMPLHPLAQKMMRYERDNCWYRANQDTLHR